MKPYAILASLAIATVIILPASCQRDKAGSGDWVAKIDDDVIAVDEFDRMYYTQNKLALNLDKNEDVDQLAANPLSLRPEIQQTIVRKNFLDHLIAQKLLYKKAMNDSAIDQKELETIVEIARLQLVSQYYLTKILMDKVDVTQEEVDNFYKSNSERFRQMPINEADRQIKQYLTLQKFKVQSNEYLMGLIGESKVNKEGFTRHEKSRQKSAPAIQKKDGTPDAGK